MLWFLQDGCKASRMRDMGFGCLPHLMLGNYDLREYRKEGARRLSPPFGSTRRMGHPAFRAGAAFNGRLDVELEPRRFGHHIGCPGGIPDELDLDL